MKILLVEDDRDLGRNLQKVLQTSGYECTWVCTAEDAQRFVSDESFDLALLDIMLPGQSGIDLLRWMRRNDHKFPVMMLTARDAVFDRVNGLDSGADDYLAKPFDIDELLSRVRALMRRHTNHRSALWKVGDLTIDTQRHVARVCELTIALSPREFELLRVLAATPGEVVTRYQLNRGSGISAALDSNALDVHIFSLRKKIGSHRITTVRGVGFVLEESAA